MIKKDSEIKDLYFEPIMKINENEWIKIEYNLLEYLVLEFEPLSSKYSGVDDFVERCTYGEAMMCSKIMKEYPYGVQHYVVHYDTSTPVNISVDVYHLGETLLSEKEILEESEGYLEDLKLDLIDVSAHYIVAVEIRVEL